MKNQPQSVEQPRFLSGWKEIATIWEREFARCSRYERALGLPVRRPAGNTTGSVVGAKLELDVWVAASPIREAFRLTKTESGAGSRRTKSIMTGIEKMTRLREQMMALPSDMRASVQALCESLTACRLTLTAKRSAKPPDDEAAGPSERTGHMQELLDSYPKQKAS